MNKVIDIINPNAVGMVGGDCENWWQRHHNKISDQNKNRKLSGLTEQDICYSAYIDVLTFNLRGIEFGNWMSQSDRIDNIIAFEKSVQTLREYFGDNIGMDCNVGVAFGARGSKSPKALATYYPIEGMINLTKEKGFGCLAHEYAHALDYIFGAYVDQNKNYTALSGGRSTAKRTINNKGGKFRNLTNEIIDYLYTTNSFHNKICKLPYEYWCCRTEMFARFFEQWMCYKDGNRNHYLYNTWSHYTKSRAYWSEAEIKKVDAKTTELVSMMKKKMSEK